MSASTHEILGLASVDLACYSVALWPGFELARHHQTIIEKLEAVDRGEITRLAVFMPPRHGKSLLATQLFPAWYLGRHPERGVITASYAQIWPTISAGACVTYTMNLCIVLPSRAASSRRIHGPRIVLAQRREELILALESARRLRAAVRT
jgi:hypothetical protein